MHHRAFSPHSSRSSGPLILTLNTYFPQSCSVVVTCKTKHKIIPSPYLLFFFWGASLVSCTIINIEERPCRNKQGKRETNHFASCIRIKLLTCQTQKKQYISVSNNLAHLTLRAFSYTRITHTAPATGIYQHAVVPKSETNIWHRTQVTSDACYYRTIKSPSSPVLSGIFTYRILEENR